MFKLIGASLALAFVFALASANRGEARERDHLAAAAGVYSLSSAVVIFVSGDASQ